MTILLITLTLLLLFGIPIAYALGMASLLYFVVAQPELLPVLPQRLFAGMQSYALIALPLFIFMGQLMKVSQGKADPKASNALLRKKLEE